MSQALVLLNALSISTALTLRSDVSIIYLFLIKVPLSLFTISREVCVVQRKTARRLKWGIIVFIILIAAAVIAKVALERACKVTRRRLRECRNSEEFREPTRRRLLRRSRRCARRDLRESTRRRRWNGSTRTRRKNSRSSTAPWRRSRRCTAPTKTKRTPKPRS
ncbi:hypothetical protein SDC9_178927 [bioreactor metagenome]|uniref:Uncharacterized protein n=1 Tax=bioreactor metagenome TaxID=1076179 RepID=A0A645H6K1_9ZZZZ